MSSYTTEVRTIIEHYSQYEEGLSTNEKIEIGRTKLFDFDYPLFSGEYRKQFETNFIRNFYFREIGFETEGQFKFRLETWLQINMPYYNQLFESELMEFDPFENYDMTTESTREQDNEKKADRERDQTSDTSGTSQGNTSETAKTNGKENNFNRGLTSDTPDSRLAITTNEGRGVIQYASEITEQKDNNASEAQSSGTTTSSASDSAEGKTNEKEGSTEEGKELEDYYERRYGSHGVKSFSELLLEYRETFVRIERMIYDEIQELFMLVY